MIRQKDLIDEYININNKMLRKNKIDQIIVPPNEKAIQTDQFLLFMPMQEKLSAVLLQYQELERQNTSIKNKLQYFEFKNKILENSLHELTFAFTNKVAEQKLKLIDDLKALDQIIQKEKKELVNQKLQSLNMKKINAKECYFEESKVLKEKKIENNNNSCEASKPNKINQKSQFIKSPKPQIPPFKNKLSKIRQKENQSIKDLTRFQAQLNLKTFMKNFELTSRSDRHSINSTGLNTSQSFRHTDRSSRRQLGMRV